MESTWLSPLCGCVVSPGNRACAAGARFVFYLVSFLRFVTFLVPVLLHKPFSDFLLDFLSDLQTVNTKHNPKQS